MFVDPKIFYNWSEKSKVNVPQHFYNVCMILCRTNDVWQPFSVKLFFRNSISHIKLNFFKVTIVHFYSSLEIYSGICYFSFGAMSFTLMVVKIFFFYISKWMSNIYAFKLISYSSNDLSFCSLDTFFSLSEGNDQICFPNWGEEEINFT